MTIGANGRKGVPSLARFRAFPFFLFFRSFFRLFFFLSVVGTQAGERTGEGMSAQLGPFAAHLAEISPIQGGLAALRRPFRQSLSGGSRCRYRAQPLATCKTNMKAPDENTEIQRAHDSTSLDHRANADWTDPFDFFKKTWESHFSPFFSWGPDPGSCPARHSPAIAAHSTAWPPILVWRGSGRG